MVRSGQKLDRVATRMRAARGRGRWMMVPALLFMVGASANLGFAAEKQFFDQKTRDALQSVIKAQLDAFEHNDAKAAESFAAPAIAQKFPEPGKFFDMVKEKYAALIHPKSTTFNETTPSPHGPLQKMTVVAADGTIWTAVYAFEQVNGNWRILGCGLMKDESQQEI